jgi:hypothetical protein
MAAHHGCRSPVSVTDHHLRQLLTGDHLHHGLLGKAGIKDNAKGMQ